MPCLREAGMLVQNVDAKISPSTSSEQPVAIEQQTAFEGQAVAEQPSTELLAYEQPAAKLPAAHEPMNQLLK
ncbi:hypothetical protein R6Q59_013597 [Mikania micrantha]